VRNKLKLSNIFYELVKEIKMIFNTSPPCDLFLTTSRFFAASAGHQFAILAFKNPSIATVAIESGCNQLFECQHVKSAPFGVLWLKCDRTIVRAERKLENLFPFALRAARESKRWILIHTAQANKTYRVFQDLFSN